jgi:hypothetical protein
MSTDTRTKATKRSRREAKSSDVQKPTVRAGKRDKKRVKGKFKKNP